MKYENLIYWMNYQSVLLFMFISLILVYLILTIGNLLSITITDFEKYSAYECGFEPFNHAKITMNIQFYLIAILFLIFDLEVIILLPWAYGLNLFSLSQHFVVFFFLILLTVGFIFEWKKGALDWI